MSEEQPLLIVILPTTKERLQEKNWFDEIEDDLRSLSKVRLYHLPHKKDAQKVAIALPFSEGRAKGKILLLKKNDREDGKNYFICTGFLEFSIHKSSPNYYYELPENVRPRIVNLKQIEQYIPHAIDCEKIDREVKAKAPWKPSEGSGPEGKKWRAYLDLYRKMLDEQCFSLPVECQEITDKLAKFFPIFMDTDDGEIKKKINEARGEPVNFCLTVDSIEDPNKEYKKEKLGKLRSFDNAIEIDLSKNFFNLLRLQIQAKKFYARALALKVEAGAIEFCKVKGQQQIDFYHEMSCENKAFSCLAVREKFTWKINPDSINPHHLNLDKDFPDSFRSQIKAGEFYVQVLVSKHWTADDAVSFNNCAKNESVTSVQLESVEFVKVEGQQQVDFYYETSCDNEAFSCLAIREEFGWKIDPDSIKPHRLMLFADFIGDLYQIDVMKRGLNEIQNKEIWGVLSGERVAKLPEEINLEWHEKCSLNDKQKSAVKKALGAKELCLIWGPPGTGKTEVIAEIALQEAIRGNKTLIASQANLAVDNALARLHDMKYGKDAVWAFRVAKENYKLENEDEKKVPMLETVGSFFLEWLQNKLNTEIESSPSGDEITKLRRQFCKHLKKIGKRPARQTSQMAELYRDHINVVGATLMETGKLEPKRYEKEVGEEQNKKRQKNLCKKLGIEEFDMVIVDEVSKAMPPELFLPILLGKRVVLVGDHKQLPPMLKLISGDNVSLADWAEEATIHKGGLDLETTIFERLWKKHGGETTSSVCEMLTMQYRMHSKIENLIRQFYKDDEGGLECGLSEEQMQNMLIAPSGIFSYPAVWIDTNNDVIERQTGTSFVNDDEIRIVGKILDNLFRDNTRDLSVGVITFYGAQLKALRKYEKTFFRKFSDGKLILGTVDRFQGRECDVVICSLVRKNNHGHIGFARKLNRINVAFSRARKMLCIIGNSGQFCYEAGRFENQEEASRAYKRVYDNCKIFSEHQIEE